MSQAHLLLRENLSSNSLSNIVEKSQKVQPPFLTYELKFNSTQLDIILISASNSVVNHGLSSNSVHPTATDEGFDESDVDSLSLISSEESFASSTCMVADHAIKNRENDSANGSSSSESDVEGGNTVKNSLVSAKNQNIDLQVREQFAKKIETFLLQEVLCYTDVTNPKTLVFVIKNDVLVFNFDNIQQLQDFYTSFNILKAVTNQRTYATTLNSSTKFNLVQRTDQNGVTHIEINRDNANAGIAFGTPVNCNPNSNIISLQTPEILNNFHTFKTNKSNLIKSNYHLSKDDLTSNNRVKDDIALKKVWKSAEDLLDRPNDSTNKPERPERKKKIKRMAPLPPTDTPPGGQNSNLNNVMKGQYIRVAVDPKKNIATTEKFVRKVEKHPMHLKTFSKNIQTFTPNWQSIPSPPNPLILTTVGVGGAKPPKYQFTSRLPDLKMKNNSDCISSTSSNRNWTNSLPRILRKPRSKSETRFSGAPHKFIDTTLPKKPPPNFPNSTINNNSSIISNRLFGLSQKLKEFGSTVVNNSNTNFYYQTPEIRRNSCGDIVSKNCNTLDSNLKSVIKKQDDRKSKNGNEKKVTFSAFATVQVV